MKLLTRMVIVAVALASLWSLSAGALAQTYPTKPVKVINAYAPGGPNEVVARPIIEHLSKVMGQQYLLENRPGANGNIGSAEVAKAAPDGYTLMFGSLSQFSSNPVLYRLPFDPIKDFAPIILCSLIPSALLVNASFPASSVKDIVALAKADHRVPSSTA